MSSESQNLLPDITEDISVPTLSNRFRLLVVPRELQNIVPSRNYRTRGSLTGRNFGKLKGFVDLPMDIALETAMYLGPRDLLQLSRLSKQFRSIFGSRSAISVWRTAFRNLNIECLPDLNELQFASLVYDKFCMACGRIIYCSRYPMLRLRLCTSCRTANLVSDIALQNQYQNAKDLICRLPCSLHLCFKPEAQLLIEKFLSLKDENAREFIVKLEQHTAAIHAGNVPMLHLLNPTPRHRSGRTKWTCTKGSGHVVRPW